MRMTPLSARTRIAPLLRLAISLVVVATTWPRSLAGQTPQAAPAKAEPRALRPTKAPAPSPGKSTSPSDAKQPPVGSPAASISLGPAKLTRYRIGAKIRAHSGDVQNILLVVAAPLTCEEQQVDVLKEDLSPAVEALDYRDLDDGTAHQMLISIPLLSAGQEAHAYVTFEVKTSAQVGPEETTSLRISSKPDAQLKRYLGPSPLIEVNHRKIQTAVREALAALAKGASKDGDKEADKSTQEADVKDNTSGTKDESKAADKAAVDSPSDSTPTAPIDDWRRVEALYDFARAHVKYEAGDDKSAVRTLEDGRGDCQAITALFVAMCRTAKIPARSVWVDGHQYAEFYLEEPNGAGHWYPMESAGSRAFGAMPTARAIMQKGDNFRVPELPRERRRYASGFVQASSTADAKPTISWVWEPL